MCLCVFRRREGHRTLNTGATEQKPILGASDANPRRLPFAFAILYLWWVHEQDKVRVDFFFCPSWAFSPVAALSHWTRGHCDPIRGFRCGLCVEKKEKGGENACYQTMLV